MYGFIFALLTAVGYGGNVAIIRRGVLTGSPVQALYVMMWGGVPLFILGTLVAGQFGRLADFPFLSYVYLSGAGVIHFLIGRYANISAIRALGANAATPFRTLSPLVAVTMALIFLDEQVTALRGLGIALVIVAPLLMAPGLGLPRPWRRWRAAGPRPPAGGAARLNAPPGMTLQWAQGVFWGLTASAAYGSTPLLIRSALRDTDAGVAGGLVAYLAAAVVLVPLLAMPGRVGHLRSIPGQALPWFGLGAVTGFLAQMFRFVALSLADVTVVTPLIQTSSLWGVLFAWLLNRNAELFSSRIIVAILVGTGGTVALVWPT